MTKIILASGSPRRKEILSALGIDFKVIKSNYEEDNKLYKNPLRLAKHHSQKKAEDVALTNKLTKNTIILGFDTFVVHKNKVIGKPKDKKDAIKILTRLSNSTHKVITAFTIIKNKKSFTDYEITEIKFRKLKKSEIISYVKNNNVLDKAGAYAIQSKAYRFVEEIRGDYYNVVGIPIFKLLRAMRIFK